MVFPQNCFVRSAPRCPPYLMNDVSHVVSSELQSSQNSPTRGNLPETQVFSLKIVFLDKSCFRTAHVTLNKKRCCLPVDKILFHCRSFLWIFWSVEKLLKAHFSQKMSKNELWNNLHVSVVNIIWNRTFRVTKRSTKHLLNYSLPFLTKKHKRRNFSRQRKHRVKFLFQGRLTFHVTKTDSRNPLLIKF